MMRASTRHLHISNTDVDFCFCDDKSSGDADGSHPSNTITGIWNVVAEVLLDKTSAHARCWTVEISNISPTIYNGTSTYFDDLTNERVEISFRAHATEFYVGVFVMHDIPMPIIKVSHTTITENLMEWMIFDPDNSKYVGKIFVSRNPILSTLEEQLLHSQNVEMNINNMDCSSLITSPEVPNNVEVPTSLIPSTATTSVDQNSGIWNVVAVISSQFTIPQARCLTVELSKISTKLYDGTATYLDENTNKIVYIPFGAHGMSDGLFFSVLMMSDIAIPLFKVSNAAVSSNMTEWSIFHPDDSTLLGRLFVNRNPILSTEDKQLLEGLSVKNYINNNECSLQRTITTEVPKDVDVSTFSITGTWTIFAKSSFQIAIPKVRCWIVEIVKISPTLYNSTTTYFDDERKLKNIISTEAHNTADGFFFGVLLMPDNSVSYAKVPGTIVEGNLVSWKVSDSNNLSNLGQLFVSRNSILSTEEKRHLARQNITDYINSTNCPLHARPMRAHTPSVHQSANPTFFCIIATYVFTFAYLFGLW